MVPKISTNSIHSHVMNPDKIQEAEFCQRMMYLRYFCKVNLNEQSALSPLLPVVIHFVCYVLSSSQIINLSKTGVSLFEHLENFIPRFRLCAFFNWLKVQNKVLSLIGNTSSFSSLVTFLFFFFILYSLCSFLS